VPLWILGELLNPTADPMEPASSASHDPSQTSSCSTPRLPEYIRAQRPSRLYARSPPAGCNSPSFGAPLQCPLPGPATERKHWNSWCVARPSPYQRIRFSRPTFSIGLTAGTSSTPRSTQTPAVAPSATPPQFATRTTRCRHHVHSLTLQHL
jgi:hypothetical protein